MSERCCQRATDFGPVQDLTVPSWAHAHQPGLTSSSSLTPIKQQIRTTRADTNSQTKPSEKICYGAQSSAHRFFLAMPKSSSTPTHLQSCCLLAFGLARGGFADAVLLRGLDQHVAHNLGQFFRNILIWRSKYRTLPCLVHVHIDRLLVSRVVLPLFETSFLNVQRQVVET
jgi:hypothetical protein